MECDLFLQLSACEYAHTVGNWLRQPAPDSKYHAEPEYYEHDSDDTNESWCSSGYPAFNKIDRTGKIIDITPKLEHG